MNQTKPTQQQLDKFVSLHVICCQSMLVDELLQRDGLDVSYENVTNMYLYTCPQCGHGEVDIDDFPGVHDITPDGDTDGYKCPYCKEVFTDEPEQEPQEVYEWWVVSDWLLEKLEAKGEPILTTDYGSWWGRTCTGQSIILDSVIEDIYMEEGLNL